MLNFIVLRQRCEHVRMVTGVPVTKLLTIEPIQNSTVEDIIHSLFLY